MLGIFFLKGPKAIEDVGASGMLLPTAVNGCHRYKRRCVRLFNWLMLKM